MQSAKIRTISETGKSSTTGNKITVTANQCGRQVHHKMCFLLPANFSQMLSTTHALRVA